MSKSTIKSLISVHAGSMLGAECNRILNGGYKIFVSNLNPDYVMLEHQACERVRKASAALNIVEASMMTDDNSVQEPCNVQTLVDR
jgi:hypothetical protein